MSHAVVLIDDDETIVDFMAQAMLEVGCEVRWRVARTGTEAMRFVQECVDGVPLPSLVLLDLNLPSFHGLEVLARLRETDLLTRFPVIVMSGSLNASDRHASLAGGASLFLPKPDDFDGFLAHARLLKQMLDGR